MSGIVEEALARAAQARRENRLEDARQELSAALTACPEVARPRVLAGLGQIERDLHRDEAALRHYEDSARLCRLQNDLPRLAHVVRHVGDIHLEEGRASQAAVHYEEALTLYRQEPQTPPLHLANALRGYALCQEQLGGHAHARALWTEARELYAAAGVAEAAAESERRVAGLSRMP